MDSQITIYGFDTCPMTQRSLARLDELGVEYDYINVDEDEQASEQVTQWGNGKRKVPVVEIRSGKQAPTRITEPTNAELDDALRGNGFEIDRDAA